MTPEEIAREAAWAQLIKQAQAAGFVVSFNAHGVAVILRDPPRP